MGTSVADLTIATGLTKGSIYGNFENKDAVALAVYHYNSGSLTDRIAETIPESGTAYMQLNSIIQFYRQHWKEVFENGGCPLLNTAIEADDQLPHLLSAVRSSFKNWAERIVGILEQGKKHGEFKTRINSIDYAHTFLILIEGGILLAKTLADHKHLYLALDRVMAIVDQEIRN